MDNGALRLWTALAPALRPVLVRRRIDFGIMVTRKTKLFAAGLVMAAGVGLAWPFRRTESIEPLKAPAAPPAVEKALPTLATAPPISPPISVAASFAADSQAPLPPKSAAPASPRQQHDEPPVATQATITPVEPLAKIAPDEPAVEPIENSAERTHIVHDGDSLARLAKRYLGDESRALEIFDLNRGALENPHWLPIGVELRIPTQTREDVP
jgi:nucleoid-associated protein YgaU